VITQAAKISENKLPEHVPSYYHNMTFIDI